MHDLGGSTQNGVRYATIGRASFPGVSKMVDADSIFINRYSLPKAGDQEKTNNKDTMWATLPHEIGHWLGLIHLHDNGPGGSSDGCAGSGDFVSTTNRYKSGAAYGEDCDGHAMGTNGADEHNIMSVSATL